MKVLPVTNSKNYINLLLYYLIWFVLSCNNKNSTSAFHNHQSYVPLD